jgi:hypothetical protein
MPGSLSWQANILPHRKIVSRDQNEICPAASPNATAKRLATTRVKCITNGWRNNPVEFLERFVGAGA